MYKSKKVNININIHYQTKYNRKFGKEVNEIINLEMNEKWKSGIPINEKW